MYGRSLRKRSVVDYYILNNYGRVISDQNNMSTSEVIETVESGLSSEKDVENSPETSEGLTELGVNIDKQIELLENKKLQLQRQEKVNRLQKLQDEVKELERSLDIPSSPKAQERSTRSSNQNQQNKSEVSIKELREMEELNKKADHYMKQFQFLIFI